MGREMGVKTLYAGSQPGAVTDAGDEWRIAPAALVLHGLGVRRMYVTGDVSPAAMMASDWGLGMRYAGSRLASDRWCLRAKPASGGETLTVLPIASWLGTQDVTPRQARGVMCAVDRGLRARLGQGVAETPAQTGFWCWKRTRGYYPPLPAELRAAFTGTQGRFQVCPAAEELPGLYQLDIRLAYAYAASRVRSGGEWRHEVRPAGGWNDLGEYAGWLPGFRGYTPARYRVAYRVPTDWSRVGLLPQGAGPVVWPDIPGYRGQTWADAAEVRLAIAQGWQVEVRERIYQSLPDANLPEYPLRCWADHLVALYGQPPDYMAPGDAGLWRSAIRAVIVQTIGLMAGRTRTVTREAPGMMGIPDTRRAIETARETDDGVVYEDERRGAAVFHHPEIAHQVWGFTRAALLSQAQQIGGERVHTGALHVPRAHVVGMALDSLYLTHDPRWPDDGRAGRYRLKNACLGAGATIPAPRSLGDLYALTGEGDG